MSRGRKAEPETEFSTAGISTRSRDFEPAIHQHMRQRQHAGRAAHVLLHVEHAGRRLEIEPAGVEAHALADQRDLGRIGIAPGHVDQPRRARRRASDRMDQRKILVSNSSPMITRTTAPWRPARVARGLFQFRRPHVVGRRVDQVAGEEHTFDHAREVGAIDALRHFECHRFSVGGAVAGEPVTGECERQRCKPCIMRRVGKTIGAGRQRLRQPRGQERVRGFVAFALDRKQDAGQLPACGRQQEMPSGFRFEAGSGSEGTSLRIKPIPNGRPCFGGHEGDGKRRRDCAGREENRMHGQFVLRRDPALLVVR